MNAEFPLLGDPEYITYVGPLSQLGSNPTSHLAEIRYPVQRSPVISVVKLLPPNGLAACNEALAWLFLNTARVKTPPNAAIMTLSERKAINIFGRKAIASEELVHNGYVLAWAAKKMEFNSIRVIFSGTKGDSKWLSILRTIEGAAIAAFDETFLNIDRNMGNILFTGKDSCIPIDHEQIFGRQDWVENEKLTHIPQDGDSLRVLKIAQAGGKITTKAFNETISKMVLHAEKHEDMLKVCRGHIINLIERVYKDDSHDIADRVLSFVSERTAQQWINKRLGVL